MDPASLASLREFTQIAPEAVVSAALIWLGYWLRGNEVRTLQKLIEWFQDQSK